MRFDKSTPVAIIGLGIMGSKVAWACARAGLETRVYDVSSDVVAQSYERLCSWSSGSELEAVRSNMKIVTSVGEAVDGVQLAFENVPEVMKLKADVLGSIGRLCEESVYIGSNTSSMICSPLAEASGRPAQFFNMNFTDPRYDRLVELMTCESTAKETVGFAKAWAVEVGMVPIWVRKEQMGYSFNRIWRAIKKEVLRQIDQGYATPEDIDRAWMMSFGTDLGPCGLMDEIGLHSVLKVEQAYYDNTGDLSDKPPASLIEKVNNNELGVITGSGFYEHPNPAYKEPGFLEHGDGNKS